MLDAISSGLTSTEYFAYASGFDGTRYLELKLNQNIGMVERFGYLVKVSAAQRQLNEDEAKRQAAEAQAWAAQREPGNDLGGADPVALPDAGGETVQHVNSGLSAPTPSVEQLKNRRFYMSVPLDTTRIGRDVQRLVEEVITHLTTADGTQVEVSLEVNVHSPDGLSQQIVRTVSENCRTLHIKDFGFEE